MDSESYSSLHSLVSAPLSIRSETKEKFDALLKAAIHKKRQKNEMDRSNENLLNDLESTTASSENLFYKNVEKMKSVERNDNDFSQHSKNYIMNKFLSQSNATKINEEILSVKVENNNLSNVVKPPIPKPRTIKRHNMTEKNQSPTISQGTFEVTSPKIVKNNESSSSNKTYNVEEIGDVVIHESPLRPKIKIKSQNRSKFLGQEDTETISDSNDSKTEIDEDKTAFCAILNKEEKSSTNVQEVIQLEELNNDSIEYTNEVARNLTNKNKSKGEKTRAVDDEELNSKNKVYSYEKIVEIVIHKTDRVKLNSLVVHPVVKIHVVDITTGKYLPKSDKHRAVVFFYENKDFDYISPIMTHTYNLQEKRIPFPSWEETILLNEDFEYFKDESHRLILFFEVLDFVSFSTLHQLHQKDCTKGWHNIAFAFLKLSGKNSSILNVGRKIRLQLYYSHLTKKKDPHNVCSAWTWWKKKKFKKYPSTVYITIKPIICPTKIVETLRSKTPVQGETSSKINFVEDMKKEISEIESATFLSNVDDAGLKTIPTWSRSTHEVCKIPNKCLTKFDSYDEGCFIMKFSVSGLYLACAVRNENIFCIIVYSVLSLREIHKVPSHQRLIYHITWSNDDELLLAASADNTISIFNLVSSLICQILPHPSFVYSCDINPEKIIASGCYDGTVRIWNHLQSAKKTEFHLFQELEGHKGYVTSLCFNRRSNILSADSTGVIIEWRKESNDWKLEREILLLDIKETVINQIMLFPKQKKLLVHARDSTIRIVDLKSGCVLQWLRGALNRRMQTSCAISSCGTYVYSGSDNGFVHIWNSKNGHEIASFVPFPLHNQFLTIHCVDFHPFDNIVAISHYGENLPILLYYFDKNIQETEINITVKESEEYELTNKNEMLKETKLKIFTTGHQYFNQENNGKLDFKGILQKMDNVIASQNI